MSIVAVGWQNRMIGDSSLDCRIFVIMLDWSASIESLVDCGAVRFATVVVIIASFEVVIRSNVTVLVTGCFFIILFVVSIAHTAGKY